MRCTKENTKVGDKVKYIQDKSSEIYGKIGTVLKIEKGNMVLVFDEQEEWYDGQIIGRYYAFIHIKKKEINFDKFIKGLDKIWYAQKRIQKKETK